MGTIHLYWILTGPSFAVLLYESNSHMHVHICAGKHVPRAVFVDLEPTVIDEVSGGQTRPN
jgi:hypothetical protein